VPKAPDTWAEECARKRGLATRIFHPDLAGTESLSQGQITRRYHARNQQIVDAAEEVFALVAPDRKGGTEDTIKTGDPKGNQSDNSLDGMLCVRFPFTFSSAFPIPTARQPALAEHLGHPGAGATISSADGRRITWRSRPKKCGPHEQ
jgi:hypothetical protein